MTTRTTARLSPAGPRGCRTGTDAGFWPETQNKGAGPTQVTAGVCVPATRSAALLEISRDGQEASRRGVLARRVGLPIAMAPTRAWSPPRPAAVRLDLGPLAAQLVSLQSCSRGAPQQGCSVSPGRPAGGDTEVREQARVIPSFIPPQPPPPPGQPAARLRPSVPPTKTLCILYASVWTASLATLTERLVSEMCPVLALPLGVTTTGLAALGDGGTLLSLLFPGTALDTRNPNTAPCT